MKMVRLSALHTGDLYPPGGYTWYSFLLEVESTLDPLRGRKVSGQKISKSEIIGSLI